MVIEHRNRTIHGEVNLVNFETEQYMVIEHRNITVHGEVNLETEQYMVKWK